MADEQTGGCQCGHVRYAVRGEPVALVVCHCSECQRQSGSAFGMSLIVPRESFALLEGETRSFSRVPDRGGSMECVFCPECGTRIFHRSTNMPRTLNVKAGTLDEPSGLRPVAQVFAGRAHDWVALPDDLARFEEGPGGSP